MAITKQKKEEILSKLRDIAGNSSTVVFANFKGLTVAEESEMRRALRAAGVGYAVAKKTLIRKAFGEKQIEGEMPDLTGETSVAYGVDAVAPARELAAFTKKFGEHLAFTGGIFGGKYMSASEMKSVAAIPSMETLRAMFAQVINSPRSRFAVVLSEVAKKKA